jgi:hypothetical protein
VTVFQVASLMAPAMLTKTLPAVIRSAAIEKLPFRSWYA